MLINLQVLILNLDSIPWVAEVPGREVASYTNQIVMVKLL